MIKSKEGQMYIYDTLTVQLQCDQFLIWKINLSNVENSSQDKTLIEYLGKSFTALLNKTLKPLPLNPEIWAPNSGIEINVILQQLESIPWHKFRVLKYY